VAGLNSYDVECLEADDVIIVQGRDAKQVHVELKKLGNDNELTDPYHDQFQFNKAKMIEAAKKSGDPNLKQLVWDLIVIGGLEASNQGVNRAIRNADRQTAQPVPLHSPTQSVGTP
jgi:hypothetical protein